MINFCYSDNDTISMMGIRHFIQRYGLAGVSPESPENPMQLRYDADSPGGYTIEVVRNPFQGAIAGRIDSAGDSVPVFENPVDTGDNGKIIAYFHSATSHYPCITANDSGVRIGFDVFHETGRILQGHLDQIRDGLDASQKSEIAELPLVDHYENLLFRSILTACDISGNPLIFTPFWPDGKNFAVCLTHDVDEIKKTYQWITRPIRCLRRGDFSGFHTQCKSFWLKIKGCEPYWTFEDIIDIEKRFQSSSTFFFLEESGNAKMFSPSTWMFLGRMRNFNDQKLQGMVKHLALNKFEVAIHGSYLSYQKPGLLEKEISDLTHVLNKKIIGIRQHHLNLTIPDTWRYQCEAGLKYDTSLGFRDRMGFRWGTSYPFFPVAEGEELPILEIPLIIMDIAVPNRPGRFEDALRIVKQVEKYQGVLTLLWHPPVFNPLEGGDLRNLYIRLNEYCSQNGAWITNARNISGWLLMRRKNVILCEKTGDTIRIKSGMKNRKPMMSLYLPKQKKLSSVAGIDGLKKTDETTYNLYNRNMNQGGIVTLEVR